MEWQSDSEHGLEPIARLVIQEFFQPREPLLRQVVWESGDLELQNIRDNLVLALMMQAEGMQREVPSPSGNIVPDTRKLIAQLTQTHRLQLETLRERAEFVAQSLQSLMEQWNYLERHSALQEKRKHDILMHLSCSGSLQDVYTLGEQINQGGRTRIYRAQHKQTGKWVALKILKARSRSALLPRFLIEGSVGKDLLHHDRLVNITDFGGFFDAEQHTGEYFIVMEVLDGMTLLEWIKANPYRGWSGEPHLVMVSQMIEALQYLHRQGFIHCDVHPLNFFVTRDNQIKLLDFGIIESIREIQALSASQAISMTQSVGGPAYQAPEQIDSLFGKPTPKTDVYALGVTLFQFFTGQLPFGIQLSSEASIQHAPVLPLPTRPAEVCKGKMPGWLDAWIVRCMEKDPEIRPELDRLAHTLRHLMTFSVDSERFDPLISSLSRVGFDDDPVLQEKVTQIRSEFLHTLNPEEMRFVPMERLEQSEDLVVERVHSKISTYLKQLEQLLLSMESWDPLLQVCPNLMCRKPYVRGKQSCPVCGTSWQMTCKELFVPCTRQDGGITNSFFASHCQEPSCKQLYTRRYRIEAALHKTVQVALQQDRCDEAAILVKVLGEHLTQSGETIPYEKYYEQCLMALSVHRQQEQIQIFNDIRHDWQVWIEDARRGFGMLHPEVQKTVLQSSRELLHEGRYLDALQNLQKFPEHTQHPEVLSLRDQIHEMLTASSLQEIAGRLESCERQRKEWGAAVERLVPNPPASVSDKKGTEGWVHGIREPLLTSERACDDMVKPLEQTDALHRDAVVLLTDMEKPFHRTEKPVTEAEHDLQQVEEWLRKLRDDYNKKQLQGVEATLLRVQQHLDTSQDKLSDTALVLEGMSQELSNVHLKLVDGREELNQNQTRFSLVEKHLQQAQASLDLLRNLTTQVQAQWPKMREEQTLLEEKLKQGMGDLNRIAYTSDRQKVLLQQNQHVQQELQADMKRLHGLEEQYKQLAEQGVVFQEQWQKIQRRYVDEKERQQALLQQITQARNTEEQLHKDLDQRLTQVRKDLQSIKHLRGAQAEWAKREQERREKILRTAISFGSVGALVGILTGVLLGWWLFARNFTLQTPGWLGSLVWGAAMGAVMVAAIVAIMGRKVFQQPWLVVLGGSVACAGISLVSSWMGKVWVGPAAGVILGGIVGWSVGGGVGAFWNVRKFDPWRTLEKALRAAKYGALFGVFAGASWGGYVGHVHLLHPSVYTWVMLVLGCLSLLSLLSTTIGYFYEGGAWSDLKAAIEVDA